MGMNVEGGAGKKKKKFYSLNMNLFPSISFFFLSYRVGIQVWMATKKRGVALLFKRELLSKEGR